MNMKTIDLFAASHPGMIAAKTGNPVVAVGLLESTHYLYHQLQRDHWAFIGHSLALPTRLVLFVGSKR
jgi:hypothetical protein